MPRRKMYVHRLAWIEAHGPIPEGMHVLHKCDNPPCYNIEHLFLGTPADNAADKMRKGRANQAKGSDIAKSKLIEEQVLGVMARLLIGRETQTAIARELGVTSFTISDIWTGRSWAHLFSTGEAREADR